MANGYLDVQAGFTKSDVLDEENGVAGADKPRVKTHNVKSQDGKEAFHVWVIYNPISKVSLLEKSMNEAMFTQGLGVKEKAFIRVASTTSTPAPLVIANTYLYEGVSATPMEEELIHIATTLAQFQRECIEEAIGHRFKVTYHCNTVHTVLASLNDARYGAHSDCSKLLCSGEDEHCHVTQDLWLPKRHEMQTATLVISNATDTYSTDLV